MGSSLNFASRFERIDQLLFSLKTSGNLTFSEGFQGRRNYLAHLNLLNIRSEHWGWSLSKSDPVDTGHNLNVHKTFRSRPGRPLNVLCTFNLRRVSTGDWDESRYKFYINYPKWSSIDFNFLQKYFKSSIFVSIYYSKDPNKFNCASLNFLKILPWGTSQLTLSGIIFTKSIFKKVFKQPIRLEFTREYRLQKLINPY